MIELRGRIYTPSKEKTTVLSINIHFRGQRFIDTPGQGGTKVMDERGLSKIRQVGIVVKDLKEAMRRYHSLLGVGPFKGYVVDSDELPGITYRGKPADYRIQVAMAQLGDFQLELVENIRGDNVYKEFLEKHGEGVQHLGLLPTDYDAAFAKMVKRGYKHIQGGPIAGKNRNGRFDYFETEHDFGLVLELLDMPEVGEDPAFIYP